MNTPHRTLDTDRTGTGRTPQSQTRRPTAPIAADLVVSFEPGLKSLPASESEALGLWADHWLRREPEAMIVMACAGPMHRSARVARLRMLRGLLARRGVAEERIRYTGDPIEATEVHSGMDRSAQPTATARLKLVNARRAERQVCSIRSMFNGDLGAREVPCTSAS